VTREHHNPVATTPAEARILTTRRHAAGRQHLAAVLNWWFGRGSLSLRRVGIICDWVTAEKNLLPHSQLSHLRNSNIRSPGLPNLDAISQVNQALWRWHVHGASDCLKHYGPHRPNGIEDNWLDDAVWLHHPDFPSEPLNLGDFAEIACGYLTLPYVGAINLSPSEARDLSQRLAHLLEQLAVEQGAGIRAGIATVLDAYPVSDPKRRERLADVILGRTDYGEDDLRDELWDLAVTVATLRGEEPSSFGPTALHLELSSTRRRS
jgi:hypothetical protein